MSAAREAGKKPMRFEITSDDHIVTMIDDVQAGAHEHDRAFATEHELKELVDAWPMKRLIEIWNRLPGVSPVHEFENRPIAIARIWRAIQAEQEPVGHAVPSRRAARSEIACREGSKAAQVCSLLCRPEGATLKEIRAATGWQAHTVRGFISRTLRKQGRKLRSFDKNGERVYRVTGPHVLGSESC
jgi:hypothetical protein